MATPIDIRADHLRIVQDVLRRHLPDDVKVWVFGSRATWATKDSSDLDLAVEGDSQVPARSLFALESAFDDSDLPYAVDIVDIKRIAERFQRIVMEQRVRLPGLAGTSRHVDRRPVATTDGLKDAHREAIIATIAANDRVERAVLFGSRATGTNTVSSDVDVALFGDRLTLTDQARLAAALDEISMAQSVDLLLYDSIRGRTLRDHIRNQGVEWYAQRPRRGERHNNASEASSEWPVVTVQELSEKVAMGPFGSSIKVSTFMPDGVPIISGQHLHGVRVDDTPGFNFIAHEHAKRLANANVRRGDVIFTHAGNIGQVAYVPEFSRFDHYVISQRQFYMRCDRSKVIPEFVALYFTSADGQHQLLANTSQVGVPSIAQPVTYLRTLHVPLPPLAEQRAIAHILGTLDDKIELNRRMNATLEAMARALFKSWFVDFDPVRAKMAGRDTGLPKEVADLFPDRLVDSELGEIPEGWAPGILGDIVSLNPESWGTSDPPQSVAYVDLTNAKWGYIEKVETYSWEQAPSRARRVLRKRDTIVATVRPGNGSFALIDEDGLTGSTGFAVLRPRRIHYRELAWCAATSWDSIDRLAHLADGGAYPAVRPDAVLTTPIVLADCGPRKAFAASAAALLDRVETNKRVSRALASLRDVLLPRLVSGELRIPVANRPHGERSDG